MLKLQMLGMLFVVTSTLYGQSIEKKAEAPRYTNAQDEAAIRELIAEGFETKWNEHRMEDALTPDKCVDDAIFINTTGGWVEGREKFIELITRLHSPGGPFHDETRRHEVEEVRFIRPDVALAVVKTFDTRKAGVPTTGQETRGIIVLTKEAGEWKVNALENTRISATPSGTP